jgi:hypothetical protein
MLTDVCKLRLLQALPFSPSTTKVRPLFLCKLPSSRLDRYFGSISRSYTPPHRRTQPPLNLHGLEDVFIATPIATPRTPAAVSLAATSPGGDSGTVKTPTASRASSSSNWRSGSSSAGSGSGQASPSGRRLLFQRSDRVTDSAKPVTGDDAQGHFPPSCCVFVAK